MFLAVCGRRWSGAAVLDPVVLFKPIEALGGLGSFALKRGVTDDFCLDGDFNNVFVLEFFGTKVPACYIFLGD